jgi:site-specific recombinase XerD
MLRLIEVAHEQSRMPDRDVAIILFMIDTGVRVGEIAGLKVTDIDFEAGRCRVFGKGAKERLVPIGRRTRRALRRSLAVRTGIAPNAPLFVGRDGDALSTAGLQNLVRRLVARSSLDVRCSPHVLRHTFARTFLANGGDVFSLQRILGHSPASLEVTRRYVYLLDDDLRETHRRASPVDRPAAGGNPEITLAQRSKPPDPKYVIIRSVRPLPWRCPHPIRLAPRSHHSQDHNPNLMANLRDLSVRAP